MYSKLHQIGNGDGHRHNDPWKIHLPKNTRIASKCIRGASKTGRKVVPGRNPRKVEQKRWNTSGTNTSQIVKNQGKNNRGKQRLYKIPQRT